MIGYFAIAGVIMLGLIAFTSLIRAIHESLNRRRESRRFSRFEQQLSGEGDNAELARQVFAGEIKLQQEVYIIIPQEIESEERKTRFEIPIAAALNRERLGEILRSYTSDGSCGIDVELNDYVKGIDLLRRMLVDLNAPHGTLIEYSQGELPIFEV